MSTALLTELMRSLSVLAMLLLLGTFLRAKIPVFQKVFLPASVIGGFIGLLLGPRIWGASHPLRLLQVTEDWVNMWSLLPGILIVPIFAAVPLGMFTNKKEDTSGMTMKQRIGFILVSCGLFTMVGNMQNIAGFGTALAYKGINPENGLYRTFGYELSQGFAGGHGTAGAVGLILQNFGEPYWEVAQGVTTTTATIGLICGMIIGILMINAAARKGKTAIMKDPKNIPAELLQGLNKDVTKQASMGRESTYNSSIETLTLHAALILVGVGLGYYLRGALVGTGIEAFSSLPVWFYCLFMMILLDLIMSKIGLGWMVDSKVRSKITGFLSDIAICAAIASVPVEAVMAYIVPIIAMCIIGFILTYLVVFKAYGWFYGDNAPFEHAIIAWGCGTGVMINGMMLLKICDPNYETPALVNFSMGFSLMGVLNILVSLYFMPILGSGQTLDLLIASVVICLVFMVMAFIGRAMTKPAAAK